MFRDDIIAKSHSEPTARNLKRKEKEIIRYMKRTYITPQSEFIEIAPLSIIATSPNLGTGDGPVGDGDIVEEAGAARGDWSNIWDNM